MVLSMSMCVGSRSSMGNLVPHVESVKTDHF